MYPKHMFYEEIRIKQDLSYIPFCPLRILYSSKFIIMASSLGTNAVVVTRVQCSIFDLLLSSSNVSLTYSNESKSQKTYLIRLIVPS